MENVRGVRCLSAAPLYRNSCWNVSSNTNGGPSRLLGWRGSLRHRGFVSRLMLYSLRAGPRVQKFLENSGASTVITLALSGRKLRLAFQFGGIRTPRAGCEALAYENRSLAMRESKGAKLSVSMQDGPLIPVKTSPILVGSTP